VRSLLEGPVGSTLFEITVNNGAVTDDGWDLMRELHNQVESNKNERRVIVGCRKGEIIF